ncbi:extracellular solute-binding protein [Myceligenerans crystallogenes]|uniref:Extracellular solute-binding protein n=1 Tax=Myceligenerans crystallogenes TaxID=316335 RepID=A0ABP4ZAB7_9MICO
MRINRKAAAAASAAAALTLTLTACGNGGGEGADETASVDLESQVGYMEDFEAGTTFQATEPVEFGLLYRDHPNYPFKEDWAFVQHLKDDNNVTFDYENVTLEDLQQKRSVLIGSGEAPDIMPVTYPGDENQFVSSGALLPISDYVQHMPNFLQKVEDWGLQEEIDAQKKGDGKYYMIPGLHEVPKPQYSIAIRQDLWDDAGLEHPRTWDEFAEQLQVIKDENPDLKYPYSDRWSINGPIEATMQTAAPNFGTAAGWGYGAGLQWNEADGRYSYAGASDEYRSLVEYFAGLVEDGLMDPESVTQDDASAIEKLANGESAAIGTNTQSIIAEYEPAFEGAKNKDAELAQIVVPGGPAGDLIPGGTRRESGLMFSADAAQEPDFLAMLQFVDWLYYSDEGLEFAKWGVEGETFEREGDKRVLADDVTWGALNVGADKLLNADFGYYNGVFSIAHGSTEDLDKSMMEQEEIDFVDGMNATKEELPIPPSPLYDEMEQEQAGRQQQALQDIVFQNTSAFIVGERSLDEWDAYVAELEGAGMTEYVDRANAAAGVTE